MSESTKKTAILCAMAFGIFVLFLVDSLFSKPKTINDALDTCARETFARQSVYCVELAKAVSK